jgi:hypothetical protein
MEIRCHPSAVADVPRVAVAVNDRAARLRVQNPPSVKHATILRYKIHILILEAEHRRRGFDLVRGVVEISPLEKT